jgi:hypothetical protein
MQKSPFPKLSLRVGTNKVRDSILGHGSRGLAHSTPTNQKTKHCSHLCPLIHWHPASKKSLPGVGGVFLTRGKWEVEVPAGGEAMAHQDGGVVHQKVMLQPARANKRAVQGEATRQPDGPAKGSGAPRGCVTTSSHTKNQLGEWEATAR